MLVQYIAYAILAIVICGCLYDYKKTVIIWFPAQMLFNAQIAVRYSSPAMSLVIAVNLFLVFYYFLKKKRLYRDLNRERFILLLPMVLTMLSYLFSMLFGIIHVTSGFTTMLKYFISEFCIVFLAQKVLNTREDLKLFVKASVVVCLAITLLGLSESILKDNLWLDFVYLNSPHDESTFGRMFYVPPFLGGQLEERFGMVRARSFFGIHIAFGIACLFYFWILLLIQRKKWNYLKNKQILSIVSFLLVAGVFMANAKTGYIGLVVLLLGLYPISKIFNVKIILPIILGVAVILFFFPQYLNNFYSLFDSKVADEGGGSTVAGRQVQFQAAMHMFEMNPIFGNGPGAIGVLKNVGNNANILGAESSWMQILPERGFFGAIVYIFMYIYMYVKFIKYIPFKPLFFFLVGLFVMETATGMLNMAIWGVVLIAAKRMFQLNSASRY